MGIFSRHAFPLLTSAVTMAFGYAHAAGEDSLRALRDEVARRMPQQGQEKLDRIQEAVRQITACPNEEPEPYGSVMELGDTEYKLATISTGGDRYCMFLLAPVHRALSVEEAQDFMAAMLIGVPATKPTGAAGESAAEGAMKFQALRKAVADGKAMPIPMELPDGSPIQQQPASKKISGPALIDCSHASFEALSEAPGTDTLGFIYNAAYEWKEISMDGGECVYLIRPINRGLTVEEANDFLVATRSGFDPTSNE